ncbi:MAG: insulinase family protein [Alistipes sp.]|nr:insulinase family protein [Alistipes sp.]
MTQPPLTVPATIDVQQATKHIAQNGTPIYVINCPEYEVVRLSFVFHAGSVTQHAPFVASATANMLAEGTEKYSAQQIAERLDYYGSYFDINIDRDYSYITFCSLSKFFPQTAEVINQVILHPTFPSQEVEIYRTKRKQQLAIERRKVETIARENFAKAMFGEKHPYGISYTEERYDTLTSEQIKEHYARRYTAQNCIVVCSGNITDEVLEIINGITSEIAHGTECGVEDFPAFDTTSERAIQHDGAVQSSIRIGRLLFPRTHPDFIPMQVLSTVLGGYFGSRLMQNLRERNGFTYGVFSAMVNFQQAGYLAIATQVGKEVTERALEEIAAEIELLRTQLIPHEELELVKNIMAGEMMRILDGPFGIADVTTENILCGFDNSHIQQNLERIRQTTPEELLTLAQRYLRTEDIVTVVAGDFN